jgi:hypothetical protein
MQTLARLNGYQLVSECNDEDIALAEAWRMYARDDAAIWLLQVGAIERLTNEVLNVYYHPDTAATTTAAVLDSTKGLFQTNE